MREKQGFLEKIIGYLFIAFLGACVLIKGYYLLPSKYFVPLILSAGAVIFVLFKFCGKIAPGLNKLFDRIKNVGTARLAVTLALVSLITKIAAVFLLPISSDSGDIHVYMETSYELASSGTVSTYADLCRSFSHLFWFAVFISPVTKIFGISTLAYSLYFSFVTTASVVLLFDAAAYKFPKGASFAAFLVFSLLPPQVLLPQFITHEIAMTFFLSLAVWCYFKLFDLAKSKPQKALSFGLFLINLLLCFALNSAGLVAAIAFVIIFILKAIKKGKKEILYSAVKAAALIAVLLFGTVLLNAVQANHSRISENYIDRNKVLWTLYVGSNSDSNADWTQRDFDAWYDYPQSFSAEQVNEYRKELLSERYQQLLSSPLKTAGLLINKFSRVNSCFNYPLHSAPRLITEEGTKAFFNTYLYPILDAGNFFAIALINFLGFFSAVKQRKQRKNELYIFAELFVMGMTAMLLITECQNKYTIPMQPMLTLASMCLLPACGRQTACPSKQAF